MESIKFHSILTTGQCQAVIVAAGDLHHRLCDQLPHNLGQLHDLLIGGMAQLAAVVVAPA